MTQDTKSSYGSPAQEPIEKETIYPALSTEDVAAIAPLSRKGAPDLFNHMPTRLIPFEESKYRKWPYFFQSTPCRYGHVCPRYTSNQRLCVDCVRLKEGKTSIGEKTGVDKRAFPTGSKHGVTVKVEKMETVDAWERRFLEAYAFHKDFKAACESAKITESQVDSRLAYSAPFSNAYRALEERLGVKKVNSSEGFIWTKEKHDRLIEVYINTGLMASARDSIGVTPFEYLQELNRNAVFAERVKEADPLAHNMLEERAAELALAGNDKLLTLVLGVKKPEYKPTTKIDMNITEKLDDRQLNARLFRLLNKLRPDPIEGEVIVLTETRADPIAGAIGRDGSTEESPEDRSVLSHSAG